MRPASSPVLVARSNTGSQVVDPSLPSFGGFGGELIQFLDGGSFEMVIPDLSCHAIMPLQLLICAA